MLAEIAFQIQCGQANNKIEQSDYLIFNCQFSAFFFKVKLGVMGFVA
jgi:hypothetical protein